jgi:ABC-2 type transport system permease protein
MALMMAAGVVFYGVEIIARTLPAALLTFVVGVSCFAALGLLVAAIAPNGDATPAITNATLLPVAFISNIFFPIENPPRWMEIAGNFFPLKAFAEAFRDCFDPTLTGSQFHWPQIGYLLLWGVVAALLAVRFFKWEPSAGSTSRRRRRDESKPVPA